MKLGNAGICLLMVAGVVLAAGCSEKLTYKRWQTLTLQSPKTEVEAVLGDPNDLEKDDHWRYHNPDKQITVNVEFVGGEKVTYSRWFDPEHGLHEIGKAAIEGTDLIERDTRKTHINPQ